MAKREDAPKGRLLFTDFDAGARSRPPMPEAAVGAALSSLAELAQNLDLDFEDDGDYLPEAPPAPPPPAARHTTVLPATAAPPAPEAETPAETGVHTRVLEPPVPRAAPENSLPAESAEHDDSDPHDAWRSVTRPLPPPVFPDVFRSSSGTVLLPRPSRSARYLPDTFFAASLPPLPEESAAIEAVDFDPETDDILSVLPPQPVDDRYQPYEGEWRGQRLGVEPPRAHPYGGITRLEEWYRPPENADETDNPMSLRQEDWYEPPERRSVPETQPAMDPAGLDTDKTIRLVRAPHPPGNEEPAKAAPVASSRRLATSTRAVDMFNDIDLDDIWRERTASATEPREAEGTVILDTDDFLKDPRLAMIAQAQAEARAASQRLTTRHIRQTSNTSQTSRTSAGQTRRTALKAELPFADEEETPPAPAPGDIDERTLAGLTRLIEPDAADAPEAAPAASEQTPEQAEDGQPAGPETREAAAEAFAEPDSDYIPEGDEADPAEPGAAADLASEVDGEAEADQRDEIDGAAGADPESSAPPDGGAGRVIGDEPEMLEPIDPFKAMLDKKKPRSAPAESGDAADAEAASPDGGDAGSDAAEDAATAEGDDAGEAGTEAEPEEAVAVDPMSVFANMDDMDFSDDVLDDEMKAMLDDGGEEEEGDAEGAAEAVPAEPEEPRPEGKVALVLWQMRRLAKAGPRGLLRKIGDMLAWRDNWWFYCDLLAAVIASASLAVILSYFLWYRNG